MLVSVAFPEPHKAVMNSWRKKDWFQSDNPHCTPLYIDRNRVLSPNNQPHRTTYVEAQSKEEIDNGRYVMAD